MAGYKLKLKRRAERMEETRRRIVQATVDLHTKVGPARTTISSIAERAGVERLTVYRHFPTEVSLHRACSHLALTTDPPPDPESWLALSDSEERLRTGLRQLWSYYSRNEQLWSNVLRDLPLMPVVQEVTRTFFQSIDRMQQTLTRAWKVKGRKGKLVRSAIGLALQFETWRFLIRRQKLKPEEALSLVVAQVRSLAKAGGGKIRL